MCKSKCGKGLIDTIQIHNNITQRYRCMRIARGFYSGNCFELLGSSDNFRMLQDDDRRPRPPSSGGLFNNDPGEDVRPYRPPVAQVDPVGDGTGQRLQGPGLFPGASKKAFAKRNGFFRPIMQSVRFLLFLLVRTYLACRWAGLRIWAPSASLHFGLLFLEWRI